MKKKYEAVLFDLDGTLVDSFAFHSEATYRFLTSKGFQVSRKQVRRNIGNTIEYVLRGCLVPEIFWNEIIREFDNYYVVHAEALLDQVFFEPGGLEVLNQLKKAKIRTGIVTNSKQALTEEIISRNHAGALFDIVSGAEEDSLNKESRCQKVLTDLGVSADRTLYVGDTGYDVRLARKCGMDICILSHKIGWEKDYSTFRTAYQPDYMAGSLMEFAGFIAY